MQHVGDLTKSIVENLADVEWNGKPIQRRGIYKGIDLDTYHQNTWLFGLEPSFSSTGLKQVINRPSEYWAYSPFNPKAFEKETKDHLSLGAAAHALILGDEVFKDRYAIRPAKVWSEKSKKEVNWSVAQPRAIEFLEANKGKTIITADDVETIKHMAAKLAENPLVKVGILNGKVERTLCAKINGIWLRARPDVLPISSGDVADLKTTGRLDDDSLHRAIFDFGYHIQAGLTKLIFDQIYGEGFFQSFSFVFVETKPPYDVRVMELNAESIDLGCAQVLHATGVLNHCLTKQKWYGFDGPANEPGWVGLPTWASTRIRNELQLEQAA